MVRVRRWAWLGVVALVACAPVQRPKPTLQASAIASAALDGPDGALLAILQEKSPVEFDALMQQAADALVATDDADKAVEALNLRMAALFERHKAYLATAPEPMLRALLTATAELYGGLPPALCEQSASEQATVLGGEATRYRDLFNAANMAQLRAAMAGRDQPVPRAPATAAELVALLPPRPAPGAPRCPVTLAALEAMAQAEGPAAERVLASYFSGARPQ